MPYIGTTAVETTMKLLFTVGLSNRHAPEADLLQAFVSDAVRSFATRTGADAELQQVRLFADELDPLERYEKKGNQHPRPGRVS
jgi:hypothetical protein